MESIPSYEAILSAHIITETARRSARVLELYTQAAIQQPFAPSELLAIIQASSFGTARISECEQHFQDVIRPLEDAYAESNNADVDELFSPQLLTQHALEQFARGTLLLPVWGPDWDEVNDTPAAWRNDST